MQHKLTISVDEKFYKALHKVVGRGNISRFLEDAARPYLFSKEQKIKKNDVAMPKGRKKDEGMEDFIDLCHRLSAESRRNGMTEEILNSILAENR